MNFLVVYNDGFGEKPEVEKLLDNCEYIADYRSDLPNSFYIKTNHNVSDLTMYLKKNSSKEARFFITEITDNCDGFVTKETWPFLYEDFQKSDYPEKVEGSDEMTQSEKIEIPPSVIEDITNAVVKKLKSS